MIYLKNIFRLISAIAAISLFLSACGGSSSGNPPPAVTPSGKIEFNSCTISTDEGSCQGSISWTSSNSNSITLSIDGIVQSNQAQGDLNIDLTGEFIEIELRSNQTILDSITFRAVCQSASAWDGAVCARYATRIDTRAPTPFIENGTAIELEVVIFKPDGAGPFPTVIFNHGSTGDGSDRNLFTRTFVSETAAKVFVDQGWMVMFPQRRGRGLSNGTYDEGFNDQRSFYSCELNRTLTGFERANDDLDAVLAWSSSQININTSQLLITGVSRGGVLSLVHAARNPNSYIGAINFVGGWLGEGCGDYFAVNQSLFIEAAAYPLESIWLYGNNDSFYSIEHSQGNFNAFIAAGGIATFNVYTRANNLNGHFLANDSALWEQDVVTYLSNLP